MSQVSKKYLSDKVYARMFEIFVSSIISVNKKDKAEKFLNDLLTNTEKIMLAKRLSIAFLILKGYDYEDIKYLLKVSTSTVWNIKHWLEKHGEGYKTILKEFMKQEDSKRSIENFFDFLEDLFPLSYGTNWSAFRRAQWQKRHAREKPF